MSRDTHMNIRATLGVFVFLTMLARLFGQQFTMLVTFLMWPPAILSCLMLFGQLFISEKIWPMWLFVASISLGWINTYL